MSDMPLSSSDSRRAQELINDRDPIRSAGSTAWMAAFALGLATSSRPDDDCIDDLVAAADGSSARLHAARHRVRSMYGDRGRTSQRAQELLDQAASRIARQPLDADSGTLATTS
ncbi:MAG: hypothetical protein KY469_02085 [Actinobacteria bacterium]|nr:hypothetical protein [Actinomycetota bacterium]